MRNSILVLVFIPGLCAACGPAPRPGNDNGGNSDAPPQPRDAPPMPDAPPDMAADAAELKTFVYAHTSSALYRVDPDTLAITLIGDFVWPGAADMMTDLAIDKHGQLVGVSFTSVYTVDPSNAKATLLSGNLGGTFNGLSFVPASSIGQTGDDVLVGTRNNDGAVFRVDPMTGNTFPVGNMGTGFSSSGDLVAVDGFGMVQTTPGATDVLVKLAPITFAATPIGSGTGFTQIWGVAYWKDKIFGFTNNGEFISIDPTTGAGTLVQGSGPQWWGAAVTTTAPIVQ
jgi:hypothetical protein